MTLRRAPLKTATPPADPAAVTRIRGDRGDIVLGWLAKLTVTLVLLGVMLFDAVALGLMRLQAAEDADVAARAAAASWKAVPDVQKAYDAALLTVEPGDTLPVAGFLLDPVDGSVELKLRRTADTLVVEKVGPLREYATATATGTGLPPV